MSTQQTQFTTQNLLNYSCDNTVSPPLLTFGMMYWNGSAWVRFSSTTLDGLYIRKDGTSTTTASIPFAQGISLATTKLAFFGGTTTANARGSITDSTSALIIQGYADSSNLAGANVNVFAGNAGDIDQYGGYVRFQGGVYMVGGDLMQNGFVTTGTSITSFGGGSNIGGTSLVGNNTNDFAVAGNAYCIGTATFQSGIGIGTNKTPPTGYSIIMTGESATTISVDRKNSGAGVGLTIMAGWASNGGTNLNAGSLTLAPGKATGSGTGTVLIQAIGGGGSGTTDRAPSTVATFGITSCAFASTYSLTAATTLTMYGSTTTNVGTSSTTTNVGAVGDTTFGDGTLRLIRPQTDLKIDLGSGSYRFNSLYIGQITMTEATNMIFGTTTGTKLGTATTQKLGVWNATPIVQPSSTGETVGFTAGAGTNVTDQSTFTGNVGSTAYRISDIVKHLKNIGLIAA